MKQIETVEPGEPVPAEGDRQREPAERPERPRINPRLVFTNPDLFFADLLMEQSEQG